MKKGKEKYFSPTLFAVFFAVLLAAGIRMPVGAVQADENVMTKRIRFIGAVWQ